jgi:clan AA aspartic protease
MSLVHTEITLKNAVDVAKADEGTIAEQQIRQTVVQALVDTGAWTLVINEALREKLGLRIVGTESGILADGTKAACNLAGPLEVWWKDRRTTCEALVLPEAREPLLGAIPLEALDLTVNPAREEVTGAHGDRILHVI